MKGLAVTAAVVAGVFVLAAAGFQAGAEIFFRVADYLARRRETAAQERTAL